MFRKSESGWLNAMPRQSSILSLNLMPLSSHHHHASHHSSLISITHTHHTDHTAPELLCPLRLWLKPFQYIKYRKTMKITLFIVFTFPYLASVTYCAQPHLRRRVTIPSAILWCDENTSLQQRQTSFLYIFLPTFWLQYMYKWDSVVVVVVYSPVFVFWWMAAFSLAVVICFFHLLHNNSPTCCQHNYFITQPESKKCLASPKRAASVSKNRTKKQWCVRLASRWVNKNADNIDRYSCVCHAQLI